ncbi:MAG: hypothetical protein V2B15_11470 [Bacteroidota bacterium]
MNQGSVRAANGLIIAGMDNLAEMMQEKVHLASDTDIRKTTLILSERSNSPTTSISGTFQCPGPA